jgi:hypothetical protein
MIILTERRCIELSVNINCDACFKEEGHYHITVEHGIVRTVDYISANGYWDRELEKDEWFVKYTDDCQVARLVNKLEAVKLPTPWNSGTPANEEWITPKVYKGARKEPSAMEKIASGVRTVHDMFLVSVDHVRRLFR